MSNLHVYHVSWIISLSEWCHTSFIQSGDRHLSDTLLFVGTIWTVLVPIAYNLPVSNQRQKYRDKSCQFLRAEWKFGRIQHKSNSFLPNETRSQFLIIQCCINSEPSHVDICHHINICTHTMSVLTWLHNVNCKTIATHIRSSCQLIVSNRTRRSRDANQMVTKTRCSKTAAEEVAVKTIR